MPNDARSEFFLFMAAAFATAIGLFVLHKWSFTYFDVHHHAKMAEAGPYDSVITARSEDDKALQGGKVPLDQAIQRLAQRGRSGFGSISPAASEDYSALSGWIRHPSFKPVTAHPIRTPRPAQLPKPQPEASQASQTPTEPEAPAALPEAAPAGTTGTTGKKRPQR
jgi:hypothetical protein